MITLPHTPAAAPIMKLFTYKKEKKEDDDDDEQGPAEDEDLSIL